ncbi:hypothetical protein BCR33DRAFT_711176, partial [Rhizoclosmatium globosum]
MNPVHQRDDAVKVSLRCSVPTPSAASANKLKGSFTYANIHSRKSAGDTAYPRFLWSATSPNSFTSSSRNIQRTIEGEEESIEGWPSKSTLMREREGGALLMRLCSFLPPPTITLPHPQCRYFPPRFTESSLMVSNDRTHLDSIDL